MQPIKRAVLCSIQAKAADMISKRSLYVNIN